MEAIEFQTIPHDGTVTIPPEYAAQWEGKTIRVIVLDAPVHHPAATEADSDQSGEPPSLFSRLKQIKISAPADFSENLDAYLIGEKNV